MGATWRINQDGFNGGWGISRGDLQLVGSGGSITLEAQDVMASYKWELISYPQGGSVVITNSTLQVATIDFAETGGYLVRLTVDESLPTEDLLVLYLGVPLAVSGLAIPALNETTFDNRWLSIDGSKGWERKMTAWLKWADTNIGGSSVGVVEQVDEIISAVSDVTGVIDLGLTEGLGMSVFATVAGNSNDCNIEFAGTAYGDPPDLYEIGVDSSLNPLWNPDSDGDWDDRNVWSFNNLVDGKLYYRLTNNGSNQINMQVQIKAIGFINAIGTAPGSIMPGDEELNIKTYTQASAPILVADGNAAFWRDTGTNKVYWVYRRGVGDQIYVELT